MAIVEARGLVFPAPGVHIGCAACVFLARAFGVGPGVYVEGLISLMIVPGVQASLLIRVQNLLTQPIVGILLGPIGSVVVPMYELGVRIGFGSKNTFLLEAEYIFSSDGISIPQICVGERLTL